MNVTPAVLAGSISFKDIVRCFPGLDPDGFNVRNNINLDCNAASLQESIQWNFVNLDLQLDKPGLSTLCGVYSPRVT
ncbi:hypothetical protein ACS0TY_023663 [Phlomoides rotata]